MKILLVTATALEMPKHNNKLIGIDKLVTGVGNIATTYNLQKKFIANTYDLVVQIGIAASFTPDIKPGEVCIVKQDTFGDIGTETKGSFSTLFESGLMKANEKPFKNGWLVNNGSIFKKVKLKKVIAVTVNKVTDNTTQTKQLTQYFSPDIESMEGAAFQYVCLMEKIPFLQIRGISNKVGVRDKSKWKIKEALENAHQVLFDIIDTLKQDS